jgi:hypothetical protein
MIHFVYSKPRHYQEEPRVIGTFVNKTEAYTLIQNQGGVEISFPKNTFTNLDKTMWIRTFPIGKCDVPHTGLE